MEGEGNTGGCMVGAGGCMPRGSTTASVISSERTSKMSKLTGVTPLGYAESGGDEKENEEEEDEHTPFSAAKDSERLLLSLPVSLIINDGERRMDVFIGTKDEYFPAR